MTSLLLWLRHASAQSLAGSKPLVLKVRVTSSYIQPGQGLLASCLC